MAPWLRSHRPPPPQNPVHKVQAPCPSEPLQAVASEALSAPRRWGQRELCHLPALTSSSQYLRITSRALSVISGASSTTLVKILPEGEGQGKAAEGHRPPGPVESQSAELAGPSRPDSARRPATRPGRSRAARWGTRAQTPPLKLLLPSTGDPHLYSFNAATEGRVGWERVLLI